MNPWWFLMFSAKESIESVNYKSPFCFQFIFISNDLEIELPSGLGCKTQRAIQCLLAEGEMASGSRFLWEVKPQNGNIFPLRTSLFDFRNSKPYNVVGLDKRVISLLSSKWKSIKYRMFFGLKLIVSSFQSIPQLQNLLIHWHIWKSLCVAMIKIDFMP